MPATPPQRLFWPWGGGLRQLPPCREGSAPWGREGHQAQARDGGPLPSPSPGEFMLSWLLDREPAPPRETSGGVPLGGVHFRGQRWPAMGLSLGPFLAGLCPSHLGLLSRQAPHHHMPSLVMSILPTPPAVLWTAVRQPPGTALAQDTPTPRPPAPLLSRWVRLGSSDPPCPCSLPGGTRSHAPQSGPGGRRHNLTPALLGLTESSAIA